VGTVGATVGATVVVEATVVVRVVVKAVVLGAGQAVVGCSRRWSRPT